MAVALMNPAGLPAPDVYRQVAVATGSTLVFLSGQVARDADGGTFADIAKPTIYVVDWTPDKMAAFGEGVMRAAGAPGIDPTKAVTLIGVAALGEPDLLVEIEATAVLA